MLKVYACQYVLHEVLLIPTHSTGFLWVEDLQVETCKYSIVGYGDWYM